MNFFSHALTYAKLLLNGGRKPAGKNQDAGRCGDEEIPEELWTLNGPNQQRQHGDPLRKGVLAEQPPAENVAFKSDEDEVWLNVLAGSGAWDRTRTQEQRSRAREVSKRMFSMSCLLFELTSTFAAQFNAMIGFSSLKTSSTEPSETTEKCRVKATKMDSFEKVQEITYLRWRVSTRAWCISCRGKDNVLEVFLIPAQDIMLLSEGEIPMRRKLKMELAPVTMEWTIDGLPAGADDLRVCIRQAFKEMIRNTQEYEQPIAEQIQDSIADDKLANSINRLFIERENLAQKVVIQQEEIQKRIARDLHDAVISDVMALKRSFQSGKTNEDEAIAALDAIALRLREICYDLSPRDLGDWGLAVVTEDMLEQIAQRTGADCVLNCDVELPPLPSAVELHIYRIVQESLNNVEKYAEATRIAVTFELENDTLSVLIADNGKGFSPDATVNDTRSGIGMGSLRERADLIRCYYPTRIDIDSKPGKGTRTTLSIDLSGRN